MNIINRQSHGSMSYEEYSKYNGITNTDLGDLSRKLAHAYRPDLRDAFAYGTAVDAAITQPSKLHFADKYYVIAQRKKALAHSIPHISKFIEISKKQQMFSAVIEIDGKPRTVKCLADLSSRNALGDIKTTACVTDTSFRKSCKQLGYYRQSAWYMNIVGVDVMYLIGLSKRADSVFLECVRRGDANYEYGMNEIQSLLQYMK